MYDGIIVGGGPAGAYLAYLMAREKLKVVVIEKEVMPRYKACGGGLTPKVLDELPFEINDVIEDTIFSFGLRHRLSQEIRVTFDHPITYMVSRERFDHLLVEKARQAGAEVVEGIAVQTVNILDDQVVVAGSNREWLGKIVVGADGARSRVAVALDLGSHKTPGVAVEIELPVSTEVLQWYHGRITVDYGLVPHGYAWIFPKSDHLSIGAGTLKPGGVNLKNLLDRFVQHEGLGEIPNNVPVRGWIVPAVGSIKRLSRNRALLLGDAAGLVDAFTGEGIYPAIRSASLAAKVIIEEIRHGKFDFRRYDSMVIKELGQELNNGLRTTNLFYPASRLIHQILQKRKDLVYDLARLISGSITYAEFYKSCLKQLIGFSRPSESIAGS
ncbi:MAG: geranylgeranyl reductase family protein [Chitinophagales bacterium]